jgi:hypothetical protein
MSALSTAWLLIVLLWTGDIRDEHSIRQQHLSLYATEDKCRASAALIGSALEPGQTSLTFCIQGASKIVGAMLQQGRTAAAVSESSPRVGSSQ